VTGATGFIGGALVDALRARGVPVVATTRRAAAGMPQRPGVEWRTCDFLLPGTLPGALAGVRTAYYLVHSMSGETRGFRTRERRSAQAFVAAAAAAGVERIVYLGGPAPAGPPR
jgi:uncharacterized protein YbjT (DUF2867 family)